MSPLNESNVKMAALAVKFLISLRTRQIKRRRNQTTDIKLMEMYVEVDSFNAFDPYSPSSAHFSHVRNITENISGIKLSKKG